MLIFKGVQKTTLIDFPGKVAATLFLPKCNFRCPFCYNAQLVLDKETGAKITEKEALSFLRDRRKFLDGVCITGGEPMLHAGLPDFCKKAKRLGLLVKIDTNGSKPEMLQK
ncbi:MAG: radical SAM protein, partial [Candidatus Diapherotrites archaeon]|nr:radical SAM protein [Candidatus Diapherotrites archaeon]